MESLARELLIIIILSAVVFLPGSALLVLSGRWRRWPGLQRLFVAIGLSISFYPVLFYTMRAVLPGVQLDRWVLMGILFVALLITIWGSWKERLFFFRPDKLEWAALIILGLTLASRLWFAYSYPFPAWSDSLHHTILTQLTADSGILPRTMEPYFPNVLDMYHLGLYALSGTVQSISQMPAHTALLWTAQFINGLCGVGIYLALDRYAGRRGAVAGLAIAGLFSLHPALWANWGRFTQLASVVLLPFAWVFFLEMVSPFKRREEDSWRSRQQIWLAVFAAVTGAAVFLFHFRVGIFYLLLLAVTAFFTLLKNRSREERLLTLRSLLLTGLGILIIILPTLWDAASSFLVARLAPVEPLDPAELQRVLENYYRFPLSSWPYLAAPNWLLIISGLAALVGLLTRNTLIYIQLAWTLLLILVGNLYLLNISVLSFTNLGAILIMLYIPISIIIGAGLEEGLQRLPGKYLGPARAVLITFILIVSLPAAYARATRVEPHRQFVSDQDIVAMQWIDENIPPDATFAINTYAWLPRFAHGTDAGYWIPYFTQRQIVTSTMLGDGLPADYLERVQDRSVAAEALESELSSLATLYNLGVEYIYIGANGDFSGPGLRLDYVTQSDAVEILYNEGGTAILQISPVGP